MGAAQNSRSQGRGGGGVRQKGKVGEGLVCTDPTAGLEPCSPSGVRFTCFSITSCVCSVPLPWGVCVPGRSHHAKGLGVRSHGASAGILPSGCQFSVLGGTSLIPGRNPFRSDYSISFPVPPIKAWDSFYAKLGPENLPRQNSQQVDHRALYQPSFPQEGPS